MGRLIYIKSMKESIKGIVLGTIKHSDRHNVTNIFTRERGRMAFLTPVGASPRGRRSASRLMPLSIVELQANISATRDLNIPSAICPIALWRTIYFNPFKSSVALFLSEFLTKLLREAPAEPSLWDYIYNTLQLYDSYSDSTSIANFHITFLINLMPMMGIQPDLDNYTEGMEFDMKAGTMVFPFSLQSNKGIRIDATKSSYLPTISRINFANAAKFHFNGNQRAELLDLILKYYGCHFPGCDNLKSLDIMREIFS